MSSIHLAFLFLTIALPFVLCGTSRRRRSARFDRGVARSIAAVLFAMAVIEIIVKTALDRLPWAAALPMHLCDWALLITAAALWWQSVRCFEVAYFWGLAGTMQGLLTPAIDPALAAWRQVGFFVIHSGIVVGVLFLVFARRLRPVPASLPRVVFWSAVYLAAALLVNALTDQNFGFLAHPPITPSLLDFFPAPPWLYVATIIAVAVAAFALLYLPWWMADQRRVVQKRGALRG